MKDFIDGFNARFAIPAQSIEKKWKPIAKTFDLNFELSVKVEKKTKVDGSFVYHGEDFKLDAKHSACKQFTLCLNERFGLQGYMRGKYYIVDIK